MVFDKLLNIDEVGGDLAHGLGQVRIVYQIECLLSEIADVLRTEATVNDVPIFIHRSHVLLNVVRGCSQRGHVGFQVDREGMCIISILLLLVLSLAARLLQLESSAGHLGQTNECDRGSCLDSLFFLVDAFGD